MIDPKDLHNDLVFQSARSGGAGGQNVNKVETKVELRFDITGSSVLSEEDKNKLYTRLASKLTNERVLVLYHQTERSQLANKEKVLAKFDALIIKSLTDPKKRKPTKPTKVSIIERMESKQRRSEVKTSRRKVTE